MIYQRKKKLADGTVKTYPHWWYKFVRDGAVIRFNTKQSNRRTAEDLENAHRTRLARGEAGFRDPRSVPTLKKFEERFIDAVKTRCAEKPRTITFYENRYACLLRFEPLASARLDRIDEALIEKFVQSRSAKAAKSTLNRDLATLRRALRLAQEWHVIDRVPRIRLLSGERCREFVLGRSVESKYLKAAPPTLRDVAELVLETGLRLGEAVGLQWDDVRLTPGMGKKYGFLQVRAGKTKNARRTVSLTARALTLLTKRKRFAVSPWVFPGHSLDKPVMPTSLAHQHKAVRDKLNLPEEFVIHSLRHTCLTRLGEAGADAFTIMRIAGHSTIAVSQRYVHPSDDAMEVAFGKLEALNDGAKAKGGHTVVTPTRVVRRSRPQAIEIKDKLA